MRIVLCCALSLTVLSCSKDEQGGNQTTEKPDRGSLGSFFVEVKPADAKTLNATKIAAKVGQTVTFEARIGGRTAPFVENRAIMVVIDTALKECPPDEGCPYPWDYCCETPDDVVANTATVQFLADDGKPMQVTLKGNHGLKELEWVTVVGEVAQRDEGGTMVVNAKSVYVGKG